MDKKKMQTKIKKAITKSVNEQNKTVDIVMSDESLDRDNEIILASAYIKRLDTFRKHAVISDSHKIGSVEDALGKFENIRVEGNRLLSTPKYFVDDEKTQTPTKNTVRWAWVLVKNGLGAYSVRFIPHDYLVGADMHGKGISEEMLKLEPSVIYTDVELVETSQVLVPANPNALAEKTAMLEEKGDPVELSICKGVFDKGLLEMPTKHFLIDFNPFPDVEDAGFTLKVQYDPELAEYDKFLKSLKVTDVSAEELLINEKSALEDVPYLFTVAGSNADFEVDEGEIEIELDDDEELMLETEDEEAVLDERATAQPTTEATDFDEIESMLEQAHEDLKSFSPDSLEQDALDKLSNSMKDFQPVETETKSEEPEDEPEEPGAVPEKYIKALGNLLSMDEG